MRNVKLSHYSVSLHGSLERWSEHTPLCRASERERERFLLADRWCALEAWSPAVVQLSNFFCLINAPTTFVDEACCNSTVMIGVHSPTVVPLFTVAVGYTNQDNARPYFCILCSMGGEEPSVMSAVQVPSFDTKIPKSAYRFSLLRSSCIPLKKNSYI